MFAFCVEVSSYPSILLNLLLKNAFLGSVGNLSPEITKKLPQKTNLEYGLPSTKNLVIRFEHDGTHSILAKIRIIYVVNG